MEIIIYFGINEKKIEEWEDIWQKFTVEVILTKREASEECWNCKPTTAAGALCPVPIKTAWVAVTNGLGLSATWKIFKIEGKKKEIKMVVVRNAIFENILNCTSKNDWTIRTGVKRYAENETIRFYRVLIHGAFIPRGIHSSCIFLGEWSK